MRDILIEARDIRKHYPVTKGLIVRHHRGWVKAVDGVTFSLARGETLGLAGESGCGKSTTAKLILLIESMTSGTLLFQGRNLHSLSRAELRNYRRSVQAVFQDPFSSLSPRMALWEIITEPVLVNESYSRAVLRDRAAELLQLVGLRGHSIDQYPHEFSGGQRQRIAIARALSLNPSVLILDEPVSSLDVSVRAQIMNLLRKLQRELGLTYLLIAHDLAVLRHMCDRIGVMYLGKLVEIAESERLYQDPLHPYTQALLSAILPTYPNETRPSALLEGEVPSPIDPPSGCHFHPRCPRAMALCARSEPVLGDMGGGHYTACYLY